MMNGKYSTKINLNFLDADFFVLKLPDYLMLPATNTYENI
jgi:hypothetical protein